MADREIYKFQWNSLIDIAEAFSELSTAYTVKDNIKAFSKLCAVAIPAGLRLTPQEKRDIPIEDLLGYMPKVMEVNKGFFSELLAGTIEVTESLHTLVRRETPTSPSPKKESAQKS